MYECTLVALDVFRSRQDVRVSSCKIRGMLGCGGSDGYQEYDGNEHD